MNLLDLPMNEPIPGSIETPSDYQIAFFDMVRTSSDSIQLEAVAGSGKSTTCCEVPNLVPGPVVFLAFMKSNVEDLRPRIPSGEVRTFNSLGHGIVLSNLTTRFDMGKLRKLLNQAVSGDLLYNYGQEIQFYTRLAKNSCIGIERKAEVWDFYNLISNHESTDVPEDMLEEVALASLRLFDLSLQNLETFDFDDQVYLPVANRMYFPTYSTIIVDEDQDLSPIQHLFLERLQAFGQSRIIGAGDRHQAIYAFRGALSNSIDLLKTRFNMREAPLSISYRCAQSIVDLAKRYCPAIEARPGAPSGTIRHLDEDPMFWDPNQMVICRTNAPLFRAILRYVRAQVPCQVKSTFLDQFESFTRRLAKNSSSIGEFQSNLDAWYTKEKTWAEKTRSVSRRRLLEDKYETLLLLSNESRTVRDLLALMKSLAEAKTGTRFSTIHKAKGLEEDCVHILRPDLMPAPWVEPSNTETFQQELNMLYVGITRAKTELTFGEKA